MEYIFSGFVVYDGIPSNRNGWFGILFSQDSFRITMSTLPISHKTARMSVDPQRQLAEIAQTCAGVLMVDRMGTAVSLPGSEEFQVLGYWDRGGREIPDEYSFEACGTAGQWVMDYGCPLLGGDARDMERYPQTYAYLSREQFASNLILPLDLGGHGRGIIYMLSRRRMIFTHDSVSVGLRVRDILEPSMRAFFAANEFLTGRSETTTGARSRVKIVQSGSQTLEEVQKSHIVHVLDKTNWVIDGPRGAARVLNLNPSTLRNKMRKLEIHR